MVALAFRLDGTCWRHSLEAGVHCTAPCVWPSKVALLQAVSGCRDVGQQRGSRHGGGRGGAVGHSTQACVPVCLSRANEEGTRLQVGCRAATAGMWVAVRV